MLLANASWSNALVLALLATSLSDLMYRRIPNGLVLTVLALGFGYWGCMSGKSGLVHAGMGMMLGLGCLLPFYLLRWIGAGDVKIFAAFGAVLGPDAIWQAALAGLACGGLLSFCYWDKMPFEITSLKGGVALKQARAYGTTVPLGAALATGILMVQMGCYP